MICFKYENIDKLRTRQWRRSIQEKHVRNRIKNNQKYIWLWELGGIPYGKFIWSDYISTKQVQALRTSFSGRGYYEDKYDRANYKKMTKRYLYEEGIL